MLDSNPYSAVREGLRVPEANATRFRFTLRQLMSVMTVIGIALGGLVWMSSFFIVVYSQSPSRANKTQLHMLSQALQTYADDHGGYPPIAKYDEAGKPLQSWRTILLQTDYLPKRMNGYDLRQAWDSPANKRFHRALPSIFQSALERNRRTGITSFFALVLPDTRPGDPFAVIVLPGNQVPFIEPRDATLAELVVTASQKEALRAQNVNDPSWVLWPNGEIEQLSVHEISFRTREEFAQNRADYAMKRHR